LGQVAGDRVKEKWKYRGEKKGVRGLIRNKAVGVTKKKKSCNRMKKIKGRKVKKQRKNSGLRTFDYRGQ